MLPTLEVVVFDLDDTLYPEEEYVYSGFKAVGAWLQEKVGVPLDETAEELKRLYDSGHKHDTFDYWLSLNRLESTAHFSGMLRAYRDHTPSIHCFPSAESMLLRCRARFRLGLLSDGHLETQRRKIESLGIQRLFDVILLSDELGRESWKPSEIPYREVLKRLNADPRKTVYIGDNPLKDFVSARKLGMKTVRVVHPHGIYSNVEPPDPGHAADIDVTSLEDVESLLLNSQRC